jgi:hypothetical protein
VAGSVPPGTFELYSAVAGPGVVVLIVGGERVAIHARHVIAGVTGVARDGDLVLVVEASVKLKEEYFAYL